jgi:hypothetical protein
MKEILDTSAGVETDFGFRLSKRLAVLLKL